MKINILLSLSFIAFSNFSLAATNKEILISLYAQGDQAAENSDFATIDFNTREVLNPSAKKCAIIDDGDKANPFLIANARRSIPPVGPLLPGKEVEKLVFGSYSVGYEFIMPPSVEDKDLVVVNPIFRAWQDSSNGTTHFISAHLFARKSGQYIAFRLKIDQNIPGFEPEIYYGYCYEEANRLF